jgi:peptidoglycan/xylan/chitin deacetylase (PgdA/CDA1 family)
MAARVTPLALAAVLALTPSPGAATTFHELDRLPTHRKLVALTFDGGGDTANGTASILRTLQRRRVPATFFLAGHWIRLHPALGRAIGRRYPIGDHTYDHADQLGLSSPQIRADVRRGAWWIRALTGRRPRPLFRFPYGARDARSVAVVSSMGYVSVRWTIDTWGWMGTSEGQSVASVVRRVSDRLEPGAIVLMHVGVARDGSLLDAQALPRVISLVRARGYRFVTLDGFVHAPK